MLMIQGTTQFQIKEPTAVVIGKFDGVHVGHQFLIQKLLEQKKKGLKTVVFTFDKSPNNFFSEVNVTYRELCTPVEKRSFFEEMGVDILVEFPMNRETVHISAKEFLRQILCRQLRCKCLIAGEDVRFGHQAFGNAKMLQACQKEFGYQVEIYPKRKVRDVLHTTSCDAEISSTFIRDKIGVGDIGTANALMGRAFQTTGTVLHGLGLAGSKLDMPTANVLWPEEKVLPALGVYFTLVKVEDETYRGITNVGKKPTVTNETQLLAETYLYDFAGDLYEREITLYFYHFLRKEEKFSDIGALKTQLEKDREAGRTYWMTR